MLLFLALFACDEPQPVKTLQPLRADPSPWCEDFSPWREVVSPFEGERCFTFGRNGLTGVVCKREESVYLKTCANPALRQGEPR